MPPYFQRALHARIDLSGIAPPKLLTVLSVNPGPSHAVPQIAVGVSGRLGFTFRRELPHP